MSVLYMGFPLGDDLEMKEGVSVQLKDDARDDRNNGFDLKTESEFWPIQHPTEPSHEDRPVQCPIPHSSHLINDERILDDRFSGRKRPEALTLLHKENSRLEATEPPIRAVRKRHHDHTKTITPLLRVPPVYPHLYQTMNPTDCNKLQQVHRFKS